MAQALIDEKEGRRRSLPSLRRQPRPDYFSIQRGGALEIEDDDVQEVEPPDPAPPPARSKKQRRSSSAKSDKQQQQAEIAFVDLTCDNDYVPEKRTPGKAGRPRGSSKDGYGLRRKSALLSGGVELQMECEEDALTPSQIEATKKAREEYRKAMKAIEQAKLANMAAAAALPPPVVSPTVVKAGGSNADDIIILGETPPVAGTPAAVQQPRLTTPVAVPPPPQMMVPHGAPFVAPPSVAGATVPQQVYRFISVGQGMPASIPAGSQVVVRPITQVSPQQPAQKAASAWSPPADTPGYVSTIVSGTSGLGIKRSPNLTDLPMVSPPSKKARGRASSETDSTGNWVPLDEYYYGKMEGDPIYFEEKSEFRFKCWMCTKMLYNNVKAMMHLQGHIDSEKQQNLDLSDLTQCKHCYKQFDTPFEMQTHIEKVHMNNVNVLMCRICEKDHDSRSALTTHMRQNHCACEMPYVCQLCNFRSSMYSDVVDHFKKKHDSSNNVLCLYCLRVFSVKFVSQGWGQTKAYYHHLLKHQSKTNNRKCTFCKLSFFNAQDLKNHRKTNHQPNQKGVIGANAKYHTPDQVMIKVPEAGLQPKKSGPKSLNAPTVTKVKEHRGLHFPKEAASSYCFECKMLMSTADHYKKYIQCSMCRFASSCSFAYASHMMGFHSGQVSSLSSDVPWERPVDSPLYCLCGFSTKYANKIANHLVSCSKRTCYLVKPDAFLTEKSGQEEQTDPRRKPDASILDVLGLVKKQSLVSTNEAEEDSGVPLMDHGDDDDDDEWKDRLKDDRTEEGQEGKSEDKKGSDGQSETDKPAENSDNTAVGDAEAKSKEEGAADTGIEDEDEMPPREEVWDGEAPIDDEPETKPTEGEAGGETERSESLEVDKTETGEKPDVVETEMGENEAKPVETEAGGERESSGETEKVESMDIDNAETNDKPQPATSDNVEAPERTEGAESEEREEIGTGPVNEEDTEAFEERLLGSPTDNTEAGDIAQDEAQEKASCVVDTEGGESAAVEGSTEETTATREEGEAEEDILADREEEESREMETNAEEKEEEGGTGDLEGMAEEAEDNKAEESSMALGAEDDSLAEKSPVEGREDLPVENTTAEESAQQETEENFDSQPQEVDKDAVREENLEEDSHKVEKEEDIGETEKREEQAEAGEKVEEMEEDAAKVDEGVETPAECESQVEEALADKEEDSKEQEEEEAGQEQTGVQPPASEEQGDKDRSGEEMGAQDSEISPGGDATGTDGSKFVEPSSFPSAAGDLSHPTSQPDSGKPEESETPGSEDYNRPEDSEQMEEGVSGKETEFEPKGLSGVGQGIEKNESSGAAKPEEPSAVGAEDSSSRPDAEDSRSSWDRGDRSEDRGERGDGGSSYDRGSSRDQDDSRSSYDSRDGDKRHSDYRSQDRWRDRDHPSSYSDRDHNRDRDHRRDRDRYDRDYDRNRHHGGYQDRRYDQRYDSHHGGGRYPPHHQGSYHHSRDRYYDQNRYGNRGGQRHGYQDRNYHRGYY